LIITAICRCKGGNELKIKRIQLKRSRKNEG
jgi:hypothetical protein